MPVIGFVNLYFLLFHENVNKSTVRKAELLHEGIFFLIHLFARDILVIKNWKLKKLSPLLSVLKVED